MQQQRGTNPMMITADRGQQEHRPRPESTAAQMCRLDDLTIRPAKMLTGRLDGQHDQCSAALLAPTIGSHRVHQVLELVTCIIAAQRLNGLQLLPQRVQLLQAGAKQAGIRAGACDAVQQGQLGAWAPAQQQMSWTVGPADAMACTVSWVPSSCSSYRLQVHLHGKSRQVGSAPHIRWTADSHVLTHFVSAAECPPTGCAT